MISVFFLSCAATACYLADMTLLQVSLGRLKWTSHKSSCDPIQAGGAPQPPYALFKIIYHDIITTQMYHVSIGQS